MTRKPKCWHCRWPHAYWTVFACTVLFIILFILIPGQMLFVLWGMMALVVATAYFLGRRQS